MPSAAPTHQLNFELCTLNFDKKHPTTDVFLSLRANEFNLRVSGPTKLQNFVGDVSAKPNERDVAIQSIKKPSAVPTL